MNELAKAVFTAPLATIFIVAGILFLLIAVVGNISGKIEPGEKGRIVSGVAGIIFIFLGLAMHVMQKTPGIPESPVIAPLQTKSSQTDNASQQPTTNTRMPKQEVVPDSQSIQKKEAGISPIQTRFDGVVANVAHFEKNGELVVLEVVVRNTSDKTAPWVCFYQTVTDLIDEATGESWQPKQYTGQPCTAVEANKSSRTWMKFKVPDPEKRTFSLSSPLFHGTLDNLVLAEHR
jgi:hypothetical protein